MALLEHPGHSALPSGAPTWETCRPRTAPDTRNGASQPPCRRQRHRNALLGGTVGGGGKHASDRGRPRTARLGHGRRDVSRAAPPEDGRTLEPGPPGRVNTRSGTRPRGVGDTAGPERAVELHHHSPVSPSRREAHVEPELGLCGAKRVLLLPPVRWVRVSTLPANGSPGRPVISHRDCRPRGGRTSTEDGLHFFVEVVPSTYRAVGPETEGCRQRGDAGVWCAGVKVHQ